MPYTSGRAKITPFSIISIFFRGSILCMSQTLKHLTKSTGRNLKIMQRERNSLEASSEFLKRILPAFNRVKHLNNINANLKNKIVLKKTFKPELLRITGLMDRERDLTLYRFSFYFTVHQKRSIGTCLSTYTNEV